MAPPGSDRPTTYTFDPRNPVPTLGGNISSQGALASAGVVDQRGHPGQWLTPDATPLSARNDVVVYQTGELAAGLEVTGRLVVRLWASSDGRDTDFTVKLIDVYPPNADYPSGFDLNVADGIVRARYRNNLDHEELLEPGRPYAFEIEMYPTSLVFQKGHRIRLDVSSSNFPRFDVNPNSAEPPNDYRRWRVAENTLYSDATHPSQLVLPVIPP
jgi:putative CocE/NonD family hydrolase